MTHQSFARETIKPILVFMYEFEMLNATYFLFDAKDNHYRRSAILESFLLHARNLIEFFEGGAKFSDDLTIADFVDGNSLEMRGVQFSFSKELMTALHKHLAHMSKARLDRKLGWELEPIRSEINNKVIQFIQDCHESNFDSIREGKDFYINLATRIVVARDISDW